MKYLLKIFINLKQFFIKMIIRIAQTIDNENLQTYYVNYKFTSIGKLHSFEAPIILEVRNDVEMHLLHQRVLNALSTNFIVIHCDPIKITEHKKISLLKEKAFLKNSDSYFELKFMINIGSRLVLDADLPEQNLFINIITPKQTSKHKIIHPYGPISNLFIIQTNDLK